jgi:hypothetical protein
MDYYQISKAQLDRFATFLSKERNDAVKSHDTETDKKSRFWFLGYEKAIENVDDFLMSLRLKKIPDENEVLEIRS